MATLKTNTLTGTSTAGSIAVTGEGNSTTTNLQQGLCKAWVNFNGTGTAAERDSFNFSSITDSNTGQYTLAVSSAMANANWSSSCLTNAYNGTGDADGHGDSHINNRTSTGGFFVSVDASNNYADAAVNDWQVFGDLA